MLHDKGIGMDIKKNCKRFADEMGSVWGRMLAKCIELSAINGTDVSAGLTDILNQLKNAKKRNEEKKQLNSEAARMTGFLVPVMYVSTLIMSVRYLDIPLSRLLRNQFFNSAGIVMFLFIVILFISNSLLIYYINDSKIDI